MRGDEQSSQFTEDELLDLSMRMAGLADTPEFVRPPSGTVEHCLLGQATNDERDMMIKALMDSAAFRNEMLLLIRGAESLEHSSISTQDTTESQMKVPEYHPFLNDMNHSIRRTSSRWVWISSLAATLLLAGTLPFILQNDKHQSENLPGLPATWRLERAAVDPALLISEQFRVVSPAESAQVQRDARLTALDAFRGILEFDASGLSINATAIQLRIPAEGREVLSVLGTEGQVLATLRIPFGYEELSGKVQAWSIGFPSRNLYVLDIGSMNSWAKWPNAKDSIAVVVLIFNRGEERTVLSNTLLRK